MLQTKYVALKENGSKNLRLIKQMQTKNAATSYKIKQTTNKIL